MLGNFSRDFENLVRQWAVERQCEVYDSRYGLPLAILISVFGTYSKCMKIGECQTSKK